MESSINYESKRSNAGRGTIFTVDRDKLNNKLRIKDKVIFDNTEYQICGLTSRRVYTNKVGTISAKVVIDILVRPWLPEAQ